MTNAKPDVWCFDCGDVHIPTVEHPRCSLCRNGCHKPVPSDAHIDFRGWRFTAPFLCHRCGIEICIYQFAFSRSCGPCDLAHSKTALLHPMDLRFFAGPHAELPLDQVDERTKRYKITPEFLSDKDRQFFNRRRLS